MLNILYLNKYNLSVDNGADLKLDFAVEGIRDLGTHYSISSANDTVEARYVINTDYLSLCAFYALTSLLVTRRGFEPLLPA